MKEYCRGCPVLKTSFFAALKGSMKDALVCLFVYAKYRPRHILFQEGHPAARVYALKSGLVKVYKTSSAGRQQMLELVRPGGLFGLEGLSSEQYPVSAEVVADSEVCFFETEKFTAALAENPELSREAVRILSRALVDYHGRLLGLGTKTARARLASFLLWLLPEDLRGGSPRARFELPLSRGEIASLIGVRLETVSRLLQLFREKRILAVSGRRVEVLELARLKALAD